MAIKKKAAAPEPAGESAPMWIVSFADLAVLLMSFFVVLYALKQGGEAQQINTAAAIRAKFDRTSEMAPNTAFNRAVLRYRGEPEAFNERGNSSNPMDGAEGDQNHVTAIQAGKLVKGGKLSFDLGQTTLDTTAKHTLEQIARKLKGINNVLQVKGHVSNDEISTLIDDPDGTALSYRRAMVVIDELVRLGINRNVLRPVPCGSFEPLQVGVYTAEGHRQNRRAEVFTTDNAASEYFPQQTVPPPPAH